MALFLAALEGAPTSRLAKAKRAQVAEDQRRVVKTIRLILQLYYKSPKCQKKLYKIAGEKRGISVLKLNPAGLGRI
jgi:hypothetical protein